MATNRDLLKEAIADAKAVKETAIANAKAALEEAFTPFLKEKLSAKLNEMEEEEMEEEMYEAEEKEMDEMKKKEDENMMDEEVSLDELLAELDEESSKDENLYEAEEEEEEMAIEDMSEDDLKSFIESVIKDMVEAGELEAGHEGMENEEGAEEEGEEEEMGGEEMEMELDEEFDINELLSELDETKEEAKEEIKEEDVTEEKAELNEFGLIGTVAALATAATAAGLTLDKKDIEAAVKKGKDAVAALFKGKKSETTSEELNEAYETVNTLKNELNEINLLNAKLLYTNKIFRNKSLTESQKVKVLTAFDKATSKQEAQLVYETLLESLKVSTTKAPIKKSLGSASKVLGGATSKPIIENDAFARMRELAGLKK